MLVVDGRLRGQDGNWAGPRDSYEWVRTLAWTELLASLRPDTDQVAGDLTIVETSAAKAAFNKFAGMILVASFFKPF